MGPVDLDAARRVVSQAELQALEDAERLRVEAEEILTEARTEATRIVEQSRRDAEDAKLSVRRELVRQLLGLRDALDRADDSFHAFLESISSVSS